MLAQAAARTGSPAPPCCQLLTLPERHTCRCKDELMGAFPLERGFSLNQIKTTTTNNKSERPAEDPVPERGLRKGTATGHDRTVQGLQGNVR